MATPADGIAVCVAGKYKSEADHGNCTDCGAGTYSQSIFSEQCHVHMPLQNDFTIKAHLKKLKDYREYLEAMQSWNEMTPVAEELILKIIANDETHGKEKVKKRAASLVEAQPPGPQIRNIDGAGRGGGRGRSQRRGESRGKVDHFNRVMFAEKPKQLKDGKCAGCGLDAHTGDCVKQANQQRRREEMAPRLQILARMLDKAPNKEERERLLWEYGKEQGRLALGRGRGRGNAQGGGRGTGGRGNLQGGGRGASGQRVPAATAPTAAVVSGAEKGDKAAASQIARPMAEKMTPKGQEICKHNICKWHAVHDD